MNDHQHFRTSERLLSLREAAEALGYTTKGLRKIVERSRAKARGARTRGPTIKFFQTSKGAPVKFRLEWIEEFIERHTTDPEDTAPADDDMRRTRRTRKQPFSASSPEAIFGLDDTLMGDGT